MLHDTFLFSFIVVRWQNTSEKIDKGIEKTRIFAYFGEVAKKRETARKRGRDLAFRGEPAFQGSREAKFLRPISRRIAGPVFAA